MNLALKRRLSSFFSAMRRLPRASLCLFSAAVLVAATAGAVTVAAGTRAPAEGVEFDSYAKALLDTGQVSAVTTDGAGGVILYTAGSDELDGRARELVGRHENVIVRNMGADVEPLAARKVVGGQGYFASTGPGGGSGALCSIGFSGWTPTGKPALFTAGHCANDGSTPYTNLTNPRGDTYSSSGFGLMAPLGRFAFQQFGGPGNTSGADGDRNSTEFAVIEVTNADVQPLPRVTDWSTQSTDDLSTSSFPIRSVGEAEIGQKISKSGRTTGLTSGVVESKGWTSLGGKYFYGFVARLKASSGDSGGALFQGDRAVGVLSGGTPGDCSPCYTFGADLQTGLRLAGGYTMSLYLDRPTQSSPRSGQTIDAGATVSGTASPGSTLTVTPAEGPAFDVAVDTSGTWRFAAPMTTGQYSYSAVAHRGFDRSETLSSSMTVVPAPTAAPVVTSPKPNASFDTSSVDVSGTGEPGSVIQIRGAAASTSTTVSSDGTWLAPIDMTVGYHIFQVTQTRPGAVASPAAAITFTVRPPSPSFTGIRDGGRYDQDTAPRSIEGEAMPGAKIAVTLDSVTLPPVIADATGRWTSPLESALDVGSHQVRSTQQVNGISSAPASIAIIVTAAPAGAPRVVSPAHGSTVESALTSVHGTGEAGASIVVTGSVTGSTVVGTDRTWTIAADLGIGRYELSVTQTRSGAAASSPTTSVFEIAPPAPSITEPQSSDTPTNASAPDAVVGRAQPYAEVSVKINTQGSASSVTADKNGDWRVALRSPLVSGTHVITAEQRVNDVTSSEARVTITVAPTPAAAPDVTYPVAGSRVEDHVSQLRGSGEPGAVVEITGSASSAVVGPDGTWAIPTDLRIGEHSLTLTQIRPGALRSLVTSHSFFVTPAAPDAAMFAAGPFSQSSAPKSISGETAPGAVLSARIDGAPPATAIADAAGRWTILFASAFGIGAHELRLTQQINGVESDASVFWIVVIGEESAESVPHSTDGAGTSANTGSTDSDTPQADGAARSRGLATTGTTASSLLLLLSLVLTLAGVTVLMSSQRRLRSKSTATSGARP